ncbi:MAG TPA: S8 family serine peptidase [Gammaproteobacteria bacterium]|nr:S8 family serine peptidase [Gammaproteobacteria bacterium]
MAGIFFQWRREFTGAGAILAGLLAGGPAMAQVNLPRLPDPPPVGGLLGELEDEVARPQEEPLAHLLDARRRLVRDLLRRNRTELERDPRGEPIVRGEVTAFSPSADALAAAQRAGFTIAREISAAGLDVRVVVLRGPDGQSTRRALRRLQRMDPGGAYDFNHVYLPVGAADPVGAEVHQATAAAERDGRPVRLGLVDGGIALGHPAFRDATIHVHGCDGSPVETAHGTATASLLVGRAEGFRGAEPAGILYAADIYCGRATGGAADAFVGALAWLAGEGVAVINTSIVGPPNRVLERIISLLAARGHVIVAAIGNDGPAARPLYPAAYPETVGVTGVNGRRRVLPEAGRGPHVDFAAPGMNMIAAAIESPYAEVRGTSFAAPLVAGLLAALIEQPDPVAAREAVARLAASAIDLGREGRDEVYGDGLVGESLRVAP